MNAPGPRAYTSRYEKSMIRSPNAGWTSLIWMRVAINQSMGPPEVIRTGRKAVRNVTAVMTANTNNDRFDLPCVHRIAINGSAIERLEGRNPAAHPASTPATSARFRRAASTAATTHRSDQR